VHEVGGFRGDVQAGCNADALQGLFCFKAVANLTQDGHVIFGPLNAQAATGCHVY
jgi:hypothetical protein